MKRKHFYAIGALVAAAVAVYLLTRASISAAAASSPPAVAGTVTSGSGSLTIDSNVNSPTFGLPITTT